MYNMKAVQCLWAAAAALCLCFFAESKYNISQLASWKDFSDATKAKILLEQNRSCHFEEARGHFEGGWEWVSDSGVNGTNCTIVDYLSPFLEGRANLPVQQPIVFLLIGDSLNRMTLGNICKMGKNLEVLPYSHSGTDPRFINHARKAKLSRTICSDDHNATTFAHFSIYGMHHECENPPFLRKTESRHYNTTAERIEELLSVEIFSRVPRNNTVYKVLVSSSLWDLSKGCNDQAGVSDLYQEQYRNGTIEVHKALERVLPETSEIFWRTSPRVSLQYDADNTAAGHGRNRANQIVLNEILRETVATNGLGTLVDWDRQVSNVDEQKLTKEGIFPDGRHYTPAPCNALVNLWMNAMFEKLESRDFSSPVS